MSVLADGVTYIVTVALSVTDALGTPIDPAHDTATFDTAAPASGLIIAEIFVQAAGADDGKEWVKLYNGSATAVDLTQYTLRYQGNGSLQAVPLSGTLAFFSCMVMGCGDAGVTVCNQVMNFNPDIENGGNEADMVGLFQDSVSTTVPVSVVLYGVTNSAGYLDETGAVGAVDAPQPANDQSIAQNADGTWSLLSTPTPGICPPF